MTRGFRRTSRGVEATFSDDEAIVVLGAVRHLVELLGSDPTSGDEVLARLFPDGYRDDPEAAAELRSLTQPDLLDAKLGALDLIATSLAERDRRSRVVLTDEQAEQWLTGLNDLRLTLGTRLGVTEDLEEEIEGGHRHDVELPLLDLYRWLGYVQESLVETLMGSLPGPAG